VQRDFDALRASWAAARDIPSQSPSEMEA
jgi:hypothetical protein